MNAKLKFAGGRNIAMKVPPHFYEATVQFYRDVVGRMLLENRPPSIGFEFGGNQLWIDRVPGLGGRNSPYEGRTRPSRARSLQEERRRNESLL